jgi:hypothetical protein
MSAHSGRLHHAIKHLREQWDIAQDTWDDPVSREFEKTHIIPLEEWKSYLRSWERSGASARRIDQGRIGPAA